MGRTKRKWHPLYFDHIVVRGNNRQNIFIEHEDFIEFFRVLHYVYDRLPYTLIAYCLMNNHYHLLILSKTPLSQTMMRINRRYSNYYKKKYSYTGHLYEKRYFSDMVMDAEGLLEVSRYIHQNPIRTKIPLVKELAHYPYSSFRYYIQPQLSPKFLQTDHLIQHFRLECEQTYQHYVNYCNENIESTSSV